MNCKRFEAMRAEQQDLSIGRHRIGNAEIDDAPPSAHVKRTAQESFSPPAFVLRRSMPWASGLEGGLMFVAFGHSLDAFEAQLRRMVGRRGRHHRRPVPLHLAGDRRVFLVPADGKWTAGFAGAGAVAPFTKTVRRSALHRCAPPGPPAPASPASF